MTQSSDNQTVATKKKKPLGPFRTGAIVPFTIVALLIYLYFVLFFDHHLKRGLEFLGTHANGAEVDIHSLHTSFWNASLEINKIEVTNAELPTHNKLQLGTIRWRMLWDAILRAKIAIDEAEILDIEIGVPRKHPGTVLPKDPPSTENKVEQIRKQALDEAEKQFQGNVFGDLATILNGADPKAQLKNLEANLKSEAKIKQLQTELAAKQTEWKKRIDSLPQNKDLEAIQTKIKSIKTSGFKNPAEVQASLQQADSLFKEADAKYKVIKETSDAFNTDINKYQNTPKEIEALVQSDLKDIESRLKIPKLDLETLSRMLFGPSFFSKLKQAEFYMSKAREYIPPKKTAAQKAEEEKSKLKPHERIKGRNYKFGIPHAYPLFWLKHAAISSKAGEGDFAGDMKGELKDLTDDQPVVGRPTILSFAGGFPKQQISGVKGQLTIDHVTDIPKEKLDLSVASFAVSQKELVQSPDVQIGFNKAQGNSSLNLELEEQNVKLQTATGFTQVDYKVAAKQKIIDDILKGAFKSIPNVDLKASALGPWNALKFNIDTNLARDLQAAFSKQIQAKIDDARKQLKEMVDGRIQAGRAQVQAQLNQIQTQLKTQMASKQAEIDKIKNQINEAKTKATKDQGKQLEQAGKKGLQDLKKKFGF